MSISQRYFLLLTCWRLLVRSLKSANHIISTLALFWKKERNRNIDWAVGRRYEIYYNCLEVKHTEENKQNWMYVWIYWRQIEIKENHATDSILVWPWPKQMLTTSDQIWDYWIGQIKLNHAVYLNVYMIYQRTNVLQLFFYIEEKRAKDSILVLSVTRWPAVSIE